MDKKKLTLYREKLRIDQSKLDQVCSDQAIYYAEVGEELALAIQRKDSAKDSMSRVAAEVELSIRQEYAKKEEKITDKKAAALVTASPKYKEYTENYLQEKFIADELSILRDAYQQRASMLKLLVELYIAKYWSEDSVKQNQKVERQAKEIKTEDIKEKLADERSGRPRRTKRTKKNKG